MYVDSYNVWPFVASSTWCNVSEVPPSCGLSQAPFLRAGRWSAAGRGRVSGCAQVRHPHLDWCCLSGSGA